MERDPTTFWRRWIIAVSALATLGSVIAVIILVVRADSLFLAGMEPLFVEPHPAHPLSDDTRMAQCILFGLFGGWSVTMAWTFATIPRSAIVPVSRALLGGLVVWYVLDSAGSILSGAAWNAASNTVYMVLITIPLVALLRRAGGPQGQDH